MPLLKEETLKIKAIKLAKNKSAFNETNSKITSKKRKILELLVRVENRALASQSFKAFRPGLKCLIGISGGQDSMCLGLFMRSFQRKWDLHFDLVHCHHGWQRESFYNIDQITKYAVFTQIDYFMFLNPKQYTTF